MRAHRRVPDGHAAGGRTLGALHRAEWVVRTAQVSENSATILGQLRQAAGPSTTIVVTTYYNPLPACRLAALAPLADIVLEGGGPVTLGLNDIIRAQAAVVDAVVVETASVVDLTEVRPDCLHPNGDGHADIAEAVADAVRDSVTGGPGRQRRR